MTDLKYSELQNYFFEKISENEYARKYYDGELERSEIPDEIIYYGIFKDIFLYIGAFSSEDTDESLIIDEEGNVRPCSIVDNYRRLLVEEQGYSHSKIGIKILTREKFVGEYIKPEYADEFGDCFYVLRESNMYSKFVIEDEGYEWILHIEKEVFLNYLWTMKNDIEDKKIQKEVEDIIYEYSIKKDIKLNDDNFDYYDVREHVVSGKISWMFMEEQPVEQQPNEMSFDELLKKHGGLKLGDNIVE